MKKLFKFGAACAMALFIIGVGKMDASAATTVDGNGITWNYTLVGDNATDVAPAAKLSGNVIMPATLDGYVVTSVGDSAFADSYELTGMVLPDTITSVGISAFAECDNLAAVNIPTSLSALSTSMFFNCRSLTSIIIPSSVVTIGAGSFNSSGLTEILIPNSVVTIGHDAFQSCTGLTSVTLPNSVTSIEGSAFAYCSNLNSVFIPNSVTSLGDSVFCYCSNLTSVNLPYGFTTIPNDTFGECTSLTNFIIPDTITTMGETAFANSGLIELNLPDSITVIGTGAFANMINLKQCQLPSGLKIITSNMFGGCSSLVDVNFPDTLEKIDFAAFADCSSLTVIDLPTTVSYIETYAFNGCTAITDIYIRNAACVITGDEYLIEAQTSIHGFSGSTAQTYATTYARTFVALALPPSNTETDLGVTAQATLIDVTITPSITIIVNPDTGEVSSGKVYIVNNSTAPIKVHSTGLQNNPEELLQLVNPNAHTDWSKLGKTASTDVAVELELDTGWKSILNGSLSTGVEGSLDGVVSPSEEAVLVVGEVLHGNAFDTNATSSFLVSWSVALE